MSEDKMDSIMKSYFSSQPDMNERKADCPSFGSLSSYASGKMENAEALNINAHCAGCKACAELVEDAHIYSRYVDGATDRSVPSRAAVRAKHIPAENKEEATPMSLLLKNKWLLVTVTAFASSFFVPKYFMQCLIIAVIFGLKWVFDTGSTKTLIMVYNAWKRQDEKWRTELDQILHIKR